MAKQKQKEIKKPFDVDWDNIDEVRRIYAENREKMERSKAIIKTCFAWTMIFVAPVAVIMSYYAFITVMSTGISSAMLNTLESGLAESLNPADVLNAIPFDYILLAWVVLIPTLIAHFFIKPIIYKYLRFVYIFTALISLVSIPFEAHSLSMCIAGFIYGFLGFWIDDMAIRAYAAIDSLKGVKGYPLFLDYFDETHGIKHTSIKYLDYQKKLQDKHNTDRVLAEKIRQNLKAEPVNDEFVPGVIDDLVLPEIDDDIEYTDILATRSGDGGAYEDLVSDIDGDVK
jgi:hypothetical protein